MAFCFEDSKNLIILNILKHKLVISCFVGLFYLNPLQGGGGVGQGLKKPPASFSHVTSTNVGISPLSFEILNSFVTLVQNFKAIPSANSKFWTWTMSNSQKNRFFWSNLYKIKVMITSLIVIIVIKLWSHDHIYNIVWVTW